jgi:hypothetical protein
MDSQPVTSTATFFLQVQIDGSESCGGRRGRMKDSLPATYRDFGWYIVDFERFTVRTDFPRS